MNKYGVFLKIGGSLRHLEVHIFARASGKVVAGIHPTITALDTAFKNGMVMKIPVAEMEGVTSGASKSDLF